mgnify:CR=1 FL=1|jgi:hypothetical protein
MIIISKHEIGMHLIFQLLLYEFMIFIFLIQNVLNLLLSYLTHLSLLLIYFHFCFLHSHFTINMFLFDLGIIGILLIKLFHPLHKLTSAFEILYRIIF